MLSIIVLLVLHKTSKVSYVPAWHWCHVERSLAKPRVWYHSYHPFNRFDVEGNYSSITLVRTRYVRLSRTLKHVDTRWGVECGYGECLSWRYIRAVETAFDVVTDFRKSLDTVE